VPHLTRRSLAATPPPPPHRTALHAQLLKILNSDRPEKLVKELFKHLAEGKGKGKGGGKKR